MIFKLPALATSTSIPDNGIQIYSKFMAWPIQNPKHFIGSIPLNVGAMKPSDYSK
jgi:hypothetical protein